MAIAIDLGKLVLQTRLRIQDCLVAGDFTKAVDDAVMDSSAAH